VANPHIEAHLALDEVAPGRGYRDRAGALVRLFKVRLFDPQFGGLREHFRRSGPTTRIR
jgi:mannose/cellobiose epimerase-like protein (N-acyl-D-glucosamine 2-epimerase family)